MLRSAGVHEPQRPFWLRTHRTLAGCGRVRVLGQVALGELLGPLAQRLVGVAPALAGGEPGDHPVDPLALLGAGELGRDEHHDALTVPVRGHRAPTALAAPDLDDRFAYARGEATAGIGNQGERTHVGNRSSADPTPTARANFTITGAR